MQVGVSVPITDFAADFGALRDFVQAAEDLGYSHIRILDHVLGADPQFHPEVPHFPYTHKSYIHEVFTLMGYLSAVTRKVELVTGILILPQRQTALVAKQAAEVDVLSGGRLRLGIGVGWNPVEYEALGEDFHNRGQRCEEQIDVLRMLWTQEVVNYQGRWHQITHAGINPLPVQRPIPIWIGAGSTTNPVPPESAIRRIGRLADGWFPLVAPDGPAREVMNKVRRYAAEAGRDPAAVGMEGRLNLGGKNPEDWVTEMKAWQEIGATCVAAGTAGGAFQSPDQHINAIQRFKEVLDA